MGQTEPREFSLSALAQLVNDPARKYEVLLHKSSKWIDWEATALLTGDAKILSVNEKSQWPLKISFSGKEFDAQQAPYEPKMQFYCRSK